MRTRKRSFHGVSVHEAGCEFECSGKQTKRGFRVYCKRKDLKCKPYQSIDRQDPLLSKALSNLPSDLILYYESDKKVQFYGVQTSKGYTDIALKYPNGPLYLDFVSPGFGQKRKTIAQQKARLKRIAKNYPIVVDWIEQRSVDEYGKVFD